jgi:regulator of chromosome condensation
LVREQSLCANFVISSTGELYAFGRNDYNQLGIPADECMKEGSTSYVQTPVRVPEIPPMMQVSCGSTFTTSITNDLDLWAWGYGERGQLGSEGGTDVEEPEQVEMRGRKCLKVSAGGQHTMMLLRPKE